MTKGTIILHRNDANHKDHPVEFSIQHAENLLKFQQSRGLTQYSIPKNNKLEFKDGAIKSKSNPRTSTRAQES